MAPLPSDPTDATAVLHWRRGKPPLHVRPLPLTAIAADAAPPWLASGPAGQPFDLASALTTLIADVAKHTAEFRTLDPDRVLVGATVARNRTPHGLLARVTPLRFRDGALERTLRGKRYRAPRIAVDGVEMLYLLSVCVPRFLDQSFDQKLITIFHELYHIGPAFDGDLRRHPGRCAIHTHSQKQYDRHMADLARAYLDGRPDPTLHGFLRLSLGQLLARHGAVIAPRLPRPKLVPVVVGRRGTR